MLDLRRCKASDVTYQAIRSRHYVPNHGQIGRQLHYLIVSDGPVVGIISGASSVYAVKCRDAFFGAVFDRDRIINNTVFRLEQNDRNAATQILCLWRRRVVADWTRVYGQVPIGFETFVEPPLTGTIYLADNWQCVGETTGRAKIHRDLAYKLDYRDTTVKLVFCKWLQREGRGLVDGIPLTVDWRHRIPRAQMPLYDWTEYRTEEERP
jgi:hypothetical protein